MQCLYCLQHLVDADHDDRRDVLFCSPFHALSYHKGHHFKGYSHLADRGEEIQTLIRQYRNTLNEPNQLGRYMKAPTLARELKPLHSDFVKEIHIIGESYVDLRGFIQGDSERYTVFRIENVQRIVEKILGDLEELLQLVSLDEPVDEEDPYLTPSSDESSVPSPVYRYGFEQEGDAQDYDSIVHRTTEDEPEEIEEVQGGGDGETQELVMRGPERMVEDDRPLFFANWGYDDSSDEEEIEKGKRPRFRAPNNTPQSDADPQDKGWLFFVPSPASGDGGDTPSLPQSQRKQQENRGDTQMYNDDSEEEEGFIFELPDARTEKKKRRTGLLLST